MDNLARTALAEGNYVAYTHGSCKGNPGPGGCAYWLYEPNGKVSDDARESLHTTNNVAELTAVLDALQATPEGAAVLICLVSSYIKDNFEKPLEGWQKNGWRKSDGKEVVNRDLWEKLILLTETREVTFHKIKGHSGDPDIERVRVLANEAADRAVKRAFCALRDAK